MSRWHTLTLVQVAICLALALVFAFSGFPGPAVGAVGAASLYAYEFCRGPR